MSGAYPWHHKPPAGTRIDRTNPLAQSLTALIPFNEGSGPPTDIVTGAVGVNSGGVPWQVSPYGSALNYSGGKITTFAAPTVNYVGPLTFFALAQTNSTSSLWFFGSSGSYAFGVNYNLGGFNCYFNSINQLPVSSIVGNGGWHLYACSQPSPTSFQFFFDGNAAGTYTVTGYPTLAKWVAQVANGGSNPTMALAGSASRAFSASEHARLAANPWQLFADPPGSRVSGDYYPWLLDATEA